MIADGLQIHIKQFSPLNQISFKYHSQLTQHMHTRSYSAGETIIRKSHDLKQLHFLLDGQIEIRESFDRRVELSARDKQCKQSLEGHAGGRATVKAVEPCEVLIVNHDKIEQFLSWSRDYKIHYLDDEDVALSDNDLIDDDFQEDWENVFVRSNLASNLSHAVIHQLMSQMEDIRVKKNTVIIKANTPGDYFYVIKQGTASVNTAAAGPFQGARIQLIPGDYFGDEALVADTLRNASVTMSTDGTLGRIDAETFNQLIKQHLVNAMSIKNLSKNEEIKIIDVRFAAEFRHGHAPGSSNIPISLLRRQLPKMKSNQLYLITPANDRRSELATYIMRQAGFRAFCEIEQTAT